VAAIAALYVVPVAFIAARLTVAKRDGAAPATSLLAIFAALTFPTFWNSSLRGMIDVAGLVPLALAALLVLKTHYLTRASWKSALAFGFLLWMTFLFRRWYAFAIIAFATASFIATALATRRESMPPLDIARRMALVYGLAGAACALPLIVFQGALVGRILTTDYADIYSAYEAGLLAQLTAYLRYFGILTLGLAFLGVGMSVARGQLWAVFTVSVAVLTALLFSRVQSPGVQHILPVALFVFPAFFFGVQTIADWLPKWGRLALVALLALNFVSTYVPGRWGPFESTRAIFPKERFPPLRIDNFYEYVRLIGDLKALGKNSKITVYASSATLSSSLLEAIDDGVGERMTSVGQVDRRDGFKWESLDADYFIIGTPTPTHLALSDQRVITIPSEEIAAGVSIGAALEALPSVYKLAEGVSARIFKRTRPITDSEIEALAERFYKYYPEWRAKDSHDVGVALATASITLGDISGAVEKVSDDSVFVHPGETRPTFLRFTTGKLFKPRRLIASIASEMLKSCRDADGVAVFLSVDSGAATSAVVLPGQSASFDLPPTGELSISVDPRQNAHCDHTLFKFEF